MNWSEAVPNLLIGLREGLEAGLVVTILLAAVRKTAPEGREARTAPVWWGVVGAVSLALSAATVLTFATDAVSSRAQEVVGGTLSVLAVILVTLMIFWMRRAARTLSGEITGKVADALMVGTGALTLTAFLAVSREGLETMLFLWTAAKAAGTSVAPIVGAAIGITIAVALCVLMFRRAVRINLGVFFSRTAVLLIVIAAGVLAYGLGDLQDAGLLPGRSWPAWDLSGHLDSGTWWVTLVSGVTNLEPRMTVLQVTAWAVYLLTVLTLFVRGSRTAPAAVAPRPREARGPSGLVTLMGRRPLATGLTLVLVPAVVAGAALVVLPRHRGTATTVTVSNRACAPGWQAGGSGQRSFAVQNTGSTTGEITLLNAGGGIVGEIETLGPGTTATLTATLTSGTYSFHCALADGHSLTSAAVAVTGSGDVAAPPAAPPVSLAELTPAADAYRSYVAPRLVTLLQQTQAIHADLAAGDLAKARTDWLPAQLTWFEVGAAYGSFGDLGDAVDGLAVGLPGGVQDKDFTGLHRLEYGLWHGQPAARLTPVAARLEKDIATLQRRLPAVTIDPADLTVRVHEILEDAQRDVLSGNADDGAHATYPEVAADVRATRVVLTLLTPLITARNPTLVATVGRDLDGIDRALAATRSGSAWRPPSAVPARAQQAVDARVGAALEDLSLIPGLLEIPVNS